MKTSQRGIDFIKEAEGFEPKEYVCPGGEKTIGYGHVLRKTQGSIPGEQYLNGITKEKAEKLLAIDIAACETVINKRVKVPLMQGQFDALVSLIFNWGSANFIKSEGLKKLNKGDYDGAIKEFSEVTQSRGKKLDGLVKRREKEAEMWNEEPKSYKILHTTSLPETGTQMFEFKSTKNPNEFILTMTLPEKEADILKSRYDELKPNPDKEDLDAWVNTEIAKMNFEQSKMGVRKEYYDIPKEGSKTEFNDSPPSNRYINTKFVTKDELVKEYPTLIQHKANQAAENQIKIAESVVKKFDYGPTKQQVEQYRFNPKPPKPYRLIIITICLIVLGLIIFSSYKAWAKPIDGHYSTCFTPPERCGDLIVKHIDATKEKIYLQAYYLTSKKIIKSLIEAKKRGVDVQLILDRTNLSESNKAKLKTLSEAGITLYEDKVTGIAHNKVIIIDDSVVITGSFNFTESADNRNAENIIVIHSQDVAKDYLTNWNNREKVQIK